MADRRIALSLLIGLVWLVTLYVNPLIENAFEPGKVSLFAAGSAALVVAQLIRNRDNPGALFATVRGHLLFWPLTLLIMTNLLASLLADDIGQSLFRSDSYRGSLINISSYLFCLVVITIIDQSERTDLLVTALLVCSIPVTVYGWLQYLGLDPVQWETVSVSDVQSTVGRSIYLGAYLAMILPFTVRAGLRKGITTGQRVVYATLAALQLGCLYLTLSRGAWLALLVSLGQLCSSLLRWLWAPELQNLQMVGRNHWISDIGGWPRDYLGQQHQHWLSRA